MSRERSTRKGHSCTFQTISECVLDLEQQRVNLFNSKMMAVHQENLVEMDWQLFLQIASSWKSGK